MKMDLYEKILAGEEKLSLVGLGYVGMPIAVAFARKIKVIGYDLNAEKIKLYQSGIDPTNEVGDDVIRQTEVEFTADETKLREAKFHIVAVPTPVNDDHTPDLTPVEGASRILGRNLTKGSVVVFESTVYPGVTEEACRFWKRNPDWYAVRISRSVILLNGSTPATRYTVWKPSQRSFPVWMRKRWILLQRFMSWL